ncbi:hypothetical protein [Myxococcus eversor]|uniref:hypothetical protein n=1 Tax=Myxococcus eversor TaxID=2709661 RepID=UPI0013D50352|nr:hypothetical protein [Myxococcus eversor]
MRWLLFAMSLAWLGCGDDVSEPSFAEWAGRAATGQCAHSVACLGDTRAQEVCNDEVYASYMRVEPVLDSGSGAKAGCVRCMRIRMEVMHASQSNQCQPLDTARIDAACGPEQQACAGAP